MVMVWLMCACECEGISISREPTFLPLRWPDDDDHLALTSHTTRTTSISIIISSMNIISNTPRSNVDMELFLSVYAHNNWYANKQVYNL